MFSVSSLVILCSFSAITCCFNSDLGVTPSLLSCDNKCWGGGGAFIGCGLLGCPAFWPVRILNKGWDCLEGGCLGGSLETGCSGCDAWLTARRVVENFGHRVGLDTYSKKSDLNIYI